MKTSRQLALSVGAALLLGTLAALAQDSQLSAMASGGTVPLSTLITAVSKNTGRKFVLDPRVRAGVTLIGMGIGFYFLSRKRTDSGVAA